MSDLASLNLNAESFSTELHVTLCYVTLRVQWELKLVFVSKKNVLFINSASKTAIC